MMFSRITIDPAVCTGKPCIRGLRFSVARLLGLLAAGETREAILDEYPYLESGDIDEALRYAAFLAEEETVELQCAPAEVIMHRDRDRLVVGAARKRGLTALLKVMKPIEENFPEIDDPVPAPKRVL